MEGSDLLFLIDNELTLQQVGHQEEPPIPTD